MNDVPSPVSHCCVTGRSLGKIHASFFHDRLDLPYESTPDEWSIILTHDELLLAIKYLGHMLNEWYRTAKSTSTSKVVKIIAVLNGVFPTVAELSHWLDFPCEFVFVKASSYVGEVRGDLVISNLPDGSYFAGHSVIILDELWESGTTIIKMKAAVKEVIEKATMEKNTSYEIKTCLLLAKPLSDSIAPEDKPDFVAIKNFMSVWLVGFGLDADQQCRGWRHLCGRCDREKACAGRSDIVEQLNKMKEAVSRDMH